MRRLIPEDFNGFMVLLGIDRYGCTKPAASLVLVLSYPMLFILYQMPVFRQSLGAWTELVSSPAFLPACLISLLLLYAWFNRIPEAGSAFRTIWRSGRLLLIFAYLWSAGILLWLNRAVLISTDHRHYSVAIALFTVDLLAIAYLWTSPHVKAVFASFPASDTADQLKAAAAESASAKRQLIEEARLAAPVTQEGSPESLHESELRSLIEVHPEHAMAWFELGVLAYQQQNTVQSQALMRKALLCDANNPIILRSLCELYRQQGRLSEALRYGKQAVVSAPKDEIAHLNLALALTNNKEYESALTHYHRTIDANPKNVQAWSNLATLLIHMKRQGDAQAAIEALLLIAPDSQEVQLLIASLNRSQAD